MKQEAETMSENGKAQLRRKIVYSKELTALEKRYLLELMMTKQEGRNQHESTEQKNSTGKRKKQS